MRKSVGLASGSIRAAGLPKEPIQVLVEYIWNGFEAGATEVSIEFQRNEMETIDTIIIKDNGKGIDYQKLDDTFSVFLESVKATTSEHLKPKKNQGKGRYAFLVIAHNALWQSTYCKDDTHMTFSLALDDVLCNEYELSEQEVSEATTTGTTVTISNFLKPIDGEFKREKLEQIMLNRFAWFLYLNRANGVRILIDGVELDYTQYINEALSHDATIVLGENKFNVSIVVWNSKIDGSYKQYHLTPEYQERESKPTGLNNNTVSFSHSVYIVSDYFTDYSPLPKGSEQHGVDVIGYKTNQAKIMNALQKSVANMLRSVYEEYMLEYADTAISEMKARSSFPQFSDDIYGRMRERDLVGVTKAIYCAVPDVFVKLKPIQEKSLIGFLSLALNGDERNDILEIVSSITELNHEQRHHFAEILKKTSLANIIEMIEYIDKRYLVIEILKSLITDLVKFSNERNHIQRIIEENYWIFGEQYNLVSADVHMQRALENYLTQLGEAVAELENIPEEDRKKRMDIFLCGSRVQDYSVEENLIVELKAPRVKLTSEVVNQIANYAHIIRKEKQFNSSERSWKFIAVCAEIDSDVLAECVDPVERHLVRKISTNFKIYAMTWDDVFTNFRIKHDHLLRKLKFRQEIIAQEVQQEIDAATKEEAADVLRDRVTESA